MAVTPVIDLPAHESPNVVVVICDDIGYGDLGSYGATMISTPRLDEIARSGARFEAMYSGGPTCTPARAALLTGRMAPRTGAGEVLFPGDAEGLRRSETTLADYLSAADYSTAAFGKWHLGQLPANGPTRRGFDCYFGLPFSNDMKPLALYEDETIIEQPADVASLTRRCTDQAIRFIEKVPSRRAFFVYIAYNMPHYPITPAPEFAGRSQAGPYGDVCEEIDACVGELWDAVTIRNDDRPTVFAFTSDHGPWFEGSTAGLRGRKFETWEGGVRVPFLMCWPGVITPGTVVKQPAATIDLVPTLLAAMPEPPVSALPFDGIDIGHLLRGEPGPEHPPIFFFDGTHVNAVRVGRWKLHVRRQSWGSDRHAQWSLPQLFDLTGDPTESYDLGERYPRIVTDLLTLINDTDAELQRSERQSS